MTLLAVRAIDLAIFGTLGSLWLGGAVFIYLLYRWIARFERDEGPRDGADAPAVLPSPSLPKAASRDREGGALPARGLASTPS